MKYYLCRLNGPRPTFPGDATDAERALMQAHVRYWMPHIEARKVVVFGPVLDPAGVWGVAVLELPDDDDPGRYSAQDPVVLAEAGFSYDIFPMATAIVRG